MKFLPTRVTKKTTLLLVFLIVAAIVISVLYKNRIKCNSIISPIEKEQLTSIEITGEDILSHISFLASDSLKGRKSGSDEDILAREYIRHLFKKYNLDLLYDSAFQSFSYIGDLKYYNCSFKTENFNGILDRDYKPIIPIDSSNVLSQVDFVGYGYDYTKGGKHVNNYSGIDVKGHWVLFFERESNAVRIPGQGNTGRYDIAKKQGAAGVLTIDLNEASKGNFVNLGYGYTNSDFTIPFIRISRAVADTLFKKIGLTTMGVLDSLSKGKNLNFHIPLTVEASVYSKRDSVHSANVIACLPGKDPILKNEYIIIGAHYDHLGIRHIPTITGDTSYIYPGADDNASGVAGLLEIAEKLSADTLLKRSIIFVAFGAEEDSKQGSRFMVDHLPVQKSKIRLMINMDMIGRMDTLNTLKINTVDPNDSLNKTLENLNQAFPTLKLKFDLSKRRNTDHSPFYLKKIPVISFTTGTHAQYHTPYDSAGLINVEGEKMIVNYIYDLIKHETNANR